LIDFGLQRKLYNSVLGVRHYFQISKMKIYKTYEGHRTQFVVLKPKERVEKQGLNQTRTSYTLNTVSGYGPYLKSQRSKNYKIGVVWKKIRFSTISPEKRDLWIHIFPTSNLVRNIRIGKKSKQRRKLSSFSGWYHR
jgi:hypothetical protein